MRRTAAPDHALPVTEMNTTPLIDVLLVLLVMFIITIPIQTHAVKLDLPGGPIVMKLRQTLRLTQQMSPVPELHLRPDAHARYGLVDEVLAIIKREQVRKFGFVGNEAYAEL